MVWSILAVVQDFRMKEVANWLNFSLIAFGLAYRSFYAFGIGDKMFLISGLAGFGVFFLLAHLFYYGRVFAGGDAKLLMGFGVILPYRDFFEFLYVGAVFVFVLFFVGSIWSLLYSIFIVRRDWKKFKREFKKVFVESKGLFLIFLVVMILTLLVLDFVLWIMFIGFLVLIVLLYLYVKSLDVCMLVRKDAGDLQEGDWLEQDVKIGKKVIKKSVHGLSKDEIRFLRKYGKKVLIKDGIPFTIAFLLAFVVIGYLLLVFGDLSFSFFEKII